MQIKDRPKIAVIGAGAIGSLVGGILANQGLDVTLVGRQNHVEAIRRQGLQIDGVAGDFKVAIAAAENLAFQPDLMLIAVKSQDVHATCETVRAQAGDCAVVMMQNGVHSAQAAAAAFGRDRIIGCTVMFNTQYLSAGKVTYANQGSIIIGKAFTDNDRAVAQLQSLLDHVAPTTVSANILGVQWTKLLVNALSNALDGMTGLDIGTCMRHPEMIRIGVRILKEAHGLIKKGGIRLAPLPGLPPVFFKVMAVLPTPLAMRVLKKTTQSKGGGDVVSSTLQSLLKGRPTEIDYLNGEFIRLGRQLSIPTPVNSKVVELIHTIEKTHHFYAPSELATQFDNPTSF